MKILKNRIFMFIFLILFLFVSNVQAELKLTIKKAILCKHNKVYAYYKNIIYFSDGYSLYVVDHNENRQVFTNERNKIKGIFCYGGNLGIFTDYEIIVFKIGSYELLWKKKFSEKITCKPFVVNKKIFVEKNSNIIAAYSIDTGIKLWQFYIYFSEGSYVYNSKILCTNNNLVYVAADNEVYVMTKDTGNKIITTGIMLDELFKTNLDEIFIKKILIYNNILYILYNNGNFLSKSLVTGDFYYFNFNNLYIDFFVNKDKLFFIDKNNKFFCLNKFSMHIIYDNKIIPLNNFKVIPLYKKNLFMFYNQDGYVVFIDFNTGNIIYEEKLIFNILELNINVDESLLYILSDNFVWLVKLS